jgi:L-aspartate oxidase
VDLRGDYLIVGSGIAALRAAVALAEAGNVLILTKAGSSEGNTGYAQGGIAAAVGDDDSPELHTKDTLAAGDGLCDERAVRVLCEEGARDVRDLLAWGAAFDRNAQGGLALAREAAHSVRRVLHARDATGREIGRVLWAKASAHPRVQAHEHALVTDLLIRDGRCIGVRFLTPEGEEARAYAPVTLLATGGAGQVFRDTTNPEVATGDGIAMAYRAGARIADLEFVQFHPTALDVAGAPRFLLSEALRGEGARLVNHADEAFMPRYEAAGDLAPRDRVSRAILRERDRTGQPVYLSMQHLPADEIHARFPFISETCRGVGLDLARDRIPVSPAAHYVMGGVETDVDGRTSIPGLFAAGEVACTGVHGANRLASNSLLEGLVFGLRAGRVMPRHAARADETWDVTFTSDLAIGGNNCRDSKEPPPDLASVRDLMWRLVGVFRDGPGLTEAVRQLDGAWCWLRAQPAASTPEQVKLASVITVGRLMARAALRREESRGGHFRADFPGRDDARWLRHVAEVI